MTMRENSQSLVDIISYGFFRPTAESRGAAQGFTHSHEMLNTCAEALPPHTVTPMEKGIPEGGLGATWNGVKSGQRMRPRFAPGLPDRRITLPSWSVSRGLNAAGGSWSAGARACVILGQGGTILLGGGPVAAVILRWEGGEGVGAVIV